MNEITITTRPNGPLLVSGTCRILDSEGNAFDTGGRPVVALCRCGASSKKPFCDGSHATCGFQADEKAG